MWANAAGQIVQDNDEYIDESGTQYPWNFPKGEIPGLSPVLEMARPSAASYQTVVDGGIAKNDAGQWVRQWGIIDWSPEQIRQNAQIQIYNLEREFLMNRKVRELSLKLMEDEAAATASAQGVPVDQILANNPAYVKFKNLDGQIAALRALL
jgi:hypothetical protein